MFLRRWFPSETRNHLLQDYHTMYNKMYGGISENPKPSGAWVYVMSCLVNMLFRLVMSLVLSFLFSLFLY